MVFRLQPAAAGQRDDVEGDSTEQQQGQDPPAALAGQAAAQHCRRWRRTRSGAARGARAATEEWPASAGGRDKRGRGGGREAAPWGLAHGRARLHLEATGDSERARPDLPGRPGSGYTRLPAAFPQPGAGGLRRPGRSGDSANVSPLAGGPFPCTVGKACHTCCQVVLQLSPTPPCLSIHAL